MSNFIAFIPCRSGSKSIKDKNIKELGGKPLIAWSIESAQQAGIEKIIVNSDSQNYLDIAKGYGAEVMLRSAELAQDKTSMFEVLRHEIPKIRPIPELVLLLQPTSPFRSKVHIKLAISMLSNNLDKYDSLISVERVPEKYNPYAMILESSADKKMLFRKLIGLKENVISWFTGKKFIGPSLSGYPINQRMMRRQDLPQCWLPDGSIYLFKTRNLKEGSIYGKRNVLLLETEGTLNLNSLEDWERAELLLQKRNEK